MSAQLISLFHTLLFSSLRDSEGTLFVCLPVCSSYISLLCLSRIAAGQQFNKLNRSCMQALRSHLNLIKWPPDTTHGCECMCTHSTEAFTCTHTRASTRSQRLNHIISAQIINDIIFGCSIYTAGQLDARGNKEEGREREKERARGAGTKKACMKRKRVGG